MAKFKILFFPIFFLALFGTADASWAATYYVDPDYTGGSNNGSQLNPWTSINWSTVNGQLANEDVLVYFSARNDDSDTDQVYSGTINLTNRTDTSSHRLTINGNSFYNPDDVNGAVSWIAYSGDSKNRPAKVDIRKSNSTKISYVTVHGFNIIQTNSDKAVDVCGDYVTVEYCDISHSGAVTNGSLVNFAPTADGAHEGTSVPCPRSTDFIFRNNNLSNSYGELLYLGGGGSASGGSRPPGAESWEACGYPSHANFQILNNTFTTGGALGAQGDGIDLKGGYQNVTISGNEFYSMSDPETRAMVINGWQADDSASNQNIIIEKNYIHDNSNWSEAISLSNTWGGAQGITIRNNIFDTNANEGIRIYTDSNGLTYYSSKWVYIYNNTFYNQGTYAIQTDSASQLSEAEIKNNLFVDNNSGGTQVYWSGSIMGSNNAYSGSFGEVCVNCQSARSVDFRNASEGDFTLTGEASAINNGANLGSFADDFSGTLRPQGAAWDIGAYEYVSGGDTVAPSAPSGLSVV